MLRPGEKLFHPLAQGGVLQQPRVLGQQVFGRLLGFLQQFDVVGKVGHFELGQAMLPAAKEVARATQLQILFWRVFSFWLSDTSTQ